MGLARAPFSNGHHLLASSSVVRWQQSAIQYSKTESQRKEYHGGHVEGKHIQSRAMILQI
jgi:hypothetical protein